MGIDGSQFTELPSLVVPAVILRQEQHPGRIDLASITNLTQRNAAYLEGASPDSCQPPILAAPTRRISFILSLPEQSVCRSSIDRCQHLLLGHGGELDHQQFGRADQVSSWQPALGEAGSGTEVVDIVSAIPNSIGTVAAQDVSTLTTLSYASCVLQHQQRDQWLLSFVGIEQCTVLAERLSLHSRVPSNQLAVINALYAAVSNDNFLHTRIPWCWGRFVDLNDLQVTRKW